jgi:hypothetical protein
MGEVGDGGESIPDPVADQLDDAVKVLGARRLTVWRHTVYRDRDGDGTGDIGWLWLRAEPRRFPGEDHDLLLVYSVADGGWQASTPDGRAARGIAETSGQDTGQAALTAAVAALSAGSADDPGTVGRSASSLPGPEELRSLPDWVSLILGGVTASVVFPFAQAIAGKAADDAYAKLRTLLGRRNPHPELDQAKPAWVAGYIRIVDPDTGLQLIVPDPVPPDAVRKLLIMDRSELGNRILVWDTARTEWFACRPE